MKLELSEGHQQDFYERLVRREVPKFLETNPHMRPHAFVHFSLAMTAYVQRHPTDRDWLIHKPLRLIREHMRGVTLEQIKAYASAVTEICKERDHRVQAMMTPFVVEDGDEKNAAMFMLRISEVLLVPEFAQNPHLPTVDLLLSIISTQKDSRLWNHFMRGIKKGNEDAVRAFQNLFEFWAANLEIPKFESIEAVSSSVNIVTKPCRTLVFAVPHSCVDAANGLYTEWINRYICSQDSFLETLKLFWDNRAAYQERANTMWQEVTHDASCDLSFRGDDTAEVTIGSLREQGLRYIQMVPKDSRPDTLAVFWYQTPISKRWYYIEHTIKGPNLRFDEWNEERDLVAKVTSLNCFLAISSIWTVCMGHFHKSKTKTGNSPVEDARNEPTYARPHFRRIDHLGQKPSPEALKRCDDHYQGQRMPPPGKTFVKQYEVPQMTKRAGVESIVVVCRIKDDSLQLSA